MDQDNSNFEIEFFEKLLKRKSDFKEVLIALGHAYTEKGLYEKGLEIDKRLTELMPEDGTVFYNLACDYSLLQDVNSSLRTLEKAIQLGYDDYEHMLNDKDLELVRKDGRFSYLVQKYQDRFIKSKEYFE